MTDLSKTIAPKSDQLNADDLIGEAMTIKITAVRGCDEAEQPVAVHFEGDDGKPYKPCKSMRRVLVNAWGADGKTYAGRSLTLYRDENVAFGGIKVGGIRISHMSHIEKDVTIALTVTRAKRTPYTVKPIKGQPAEREAPVSEDAETLAVLDQGDPLAVPMMDLTEDEWVAWVEAFRAKVMKEGKASIQMMTIWKDYYDRQLSPLSEIDPELFERLETWFGERLKRLREREEAASQ